MRLAGGSPRRPTQEGLDSMSSDFSVDPTTRSGDPFYAVAAHRPDETVEAQYASLERLECPWCFGGYLTITVEVDGQERDEAVPCKRCKQA